MRRSAPKLGAEALRRSRPVRNPAVQETNRDGTLVLTGPAALRGIFGAALRRVAKGDVLKQYELEAVGAYVWSQIDGETDFSTLSKRLQTRHKMNRLEAEASLSEFLKMLADRGLITLMVKG